jgi:membrane protease YdiL (CAAX protease family)
MTPEPVATAPPTSPPPLPLPALGARARGMLIGEIVVVIALGILPHMSSYLYGWANESRPRTTRDAPYYVYGIARNIQIVLPLLWIMFRSGQPWRYFGLVRFDPRVDIPFGVLIAIAIYIVSMTVGYTFYFLELRFPALAHALDAVGDNAGAVKSMRAPVQGAATWTALALYMFANGIGEEFVLRGHLLTRMRELTGRTVLSITLVSALAAAYHLYQGSTAALVIFAGQIVICWVYVKVPRLWAFALGHGIYDLLLMVLWNLRH